MLFMLSPTTLWKFIRSSFGSVFFITCYNINKFNTRPMNSEIGFFLCSLISIKWCVNWQENDHSGHASCKENDTYSSFYKRNAFSQNNFSTLHEVSKWFKSRIRIHFWIDFIFRTNGWTEHGTESYKKCSFTMKSFYEKKKLVVNLYRWTSSFSNSEY